MIIVACSLALLGTAVCLLVYAGLKITTSGISFYRHHYLQFTSQELDEVYSTFRAEQYWHFSIIFGLVFGAVFMLLTFNLIVAFVFAVIGILLPQYYLKYQKKKRINAYNEQISDTIMLISNLLKSGISIRNAVKVIVEEMPAPTCEEFAVIDKEISLGTSFIDAFSHMCDKGFSNDINMVYNAMAIAQKTGGNLSEIFETIAQTIRDRKEIHDKVDALTAQGKLQGWIVGLLPVLLLVLMQFINPQLTAPLFSSTLGYGLLGLVMILEVLGIVFIRKVIAIEV